MIINRQIKKYRELNNLTQEQLADKMFISRQSVSKWEQGISLPSIDNLLLLCDVLNIPLNELIKDNEYLDIPYTFGKPLNYWPVVRAIILPAISLIVAVLSKSLKMKLIAIGCAIFLLGLYISITWFDFSRYYNYFIIKHRGIEVNTTEGLEIIKIIKGIFNKRSSKFIYYDEIESIEIMINDRGYQPNIETSLNYKPRQMYRVREKAELILHLKNSEEYHLNLDLIYEKEHHKTLIAMMKLFEDKGILIIDDLGILDAIIKEYSIIEAVYNIKNKE